MTFLVGVGAPKMFASGRFRRSYATDGKYMNLPREENQIPKECRFGTNAHNDAA